MRTTRKTFFFLPYKKKSLKLIIKKKFVALLKKSLETINNKWDVKDVKRKKYIFSLETHFNSCCWVSNCKSLCLGDEIYLKDFNQIFNKLFKMNYVLCKEILCHLSYLHVCEL